MKYIFWHIVLILILLVVNGCSSDESHFAASTNASNEHWQPLDKGLELGRFNAYNPSMRGNARIHILRIDPDVYQLQLMNASATKDNRKRTAKKWSQEYRLVSAINASMYQKDHLTSVSLMRSENHINNAYLSKDKTILAFHPKNASDLPVKMIDRECDDFHILSKKYNSLIQSIRMISCKHENVWSRQPEKWSIAAIGMDSKNRVLFIHTQSAFRAHDFINALLALPIQIAQAMYVEGGPEAQLYIQTPSLTFEFTGGYENDYKGPNQIARPIPNVIGIKKKTVFTKE